MLFKLSNLNSNLTLTLGYLNPALNNSALGYSSTNHAPLRHLLHLIVLFTLFYFKMVTVLLFYYFVGIKD